MSDHRNNPDETDAHNDGSIEIPPTIIHQPDPAADEIDPRVAEILDDYFEKLQSGNAPSADEILAAHPEHAEELAACLDGIHLVQDVTSDPVNPAKSIQQLGDFRIIREVGRGGMGVVYEAEQVSLKRRVALKILRHMVADREAMERFQREAETVASLHHSNIVPIFAVGQADGVHYFAMQFIDGESLADVQHKAKSEKASFEPLDVADWGLQAAEALAYAHEHNIIHRDVKPSNLIRDEEGRIWLTDFGLAKRIDDVQLSMTGAILGTPRYMSPEQASSVRMPVDHRTDIYSLGATLYEFATGKPLFDADSTHIALGRILADEPVAPRVVRPGLPRDLETIIMRCLSKDATQRYESAHELVSDLRAFIDGRPINARRPSIVERVGRWLQKNQRQVTTAVIGAAVAAILLGGTRLAFHEYHQSQLGRVTFDITRKLPMPIVATVVDKDGAAVVPSFTLPTQQTVEIPRGDYRLRLNSDGELMDQYQFSVYANQQPREVTTHLTDRNAWKPKEISSEWCIWPRDDGDAIVVFDSDGVTLLDAASSEQIWRSELSAALKSIGGRHELTKDFRWRTNRNDHVDCYEQPALVGPKVDFDQDGNLDLVLACRFRPLVFALSGADGKLLWRNFMPCKDRGPDSYEHGAVHGAPLVKDLNGDDVPDVIACFMTRDNVAKCFLQAADGKDGSSLWSYEIEPKYYKNVRTIPRPPFMARWYVDDLRLSGGSVHSIGGSNVYSVHDSDESRTQISGALAPLPLRFAPQSDESTLQCCIGDVLLRFDAKTGEVVASDTLSGIPVRQPQWVDANGDGNAQLLICTRNLPKTNVSGVPVMDHPRLRLELWDLQKSAAVWKKDIVADWEWAMSAEEMTSSTRDWPLIRDIDHDGKPEIVLAGASTAGKTWAAEPIGRLQLLDAKTGEIKWTTEPVVNIDRQLSHFAIVKDLDNDGIQDIAAATRFSKPDYDQENERRIPFSIYVDVFSGSDGRPIRRIESTRHVHGSYSMPQFHRVQALGNKLMVELRRVKNQNASDQSLLFDLQAGVCEWTLDDTRGLVSVDLGDTGRGFVCWTPNDSREVKKGGMLRAFRMRTPARTPSEDTWQYIDQHLVACADVNGDGIDDALSVPEKSGVANMVSGATGEYLWTREQQFTHATPTTTDFDQDGAPDVIMSVVGRNMYHPTDTPLALVSGRTGALLFKMRLDEKVQWGKQRVLTTDMNGDDHPDVLVLGQCDYRSKVLVGTRSRWDLPWSAFVLDGRTGQVLATNQFGAVGGSAAETFADFQDVVKDLDGDSVCDLIGYGVDASGMLQLQACSGRDGSWLWREGKAADQKHSATNRRYPHFCCVHDEQTERTTIVSAASFGSQSNRQQLVVKAIDGQSGSDLWEWTAPMYFRGAGRSDGREGSKYGGAVPIHVRTKEGARIGIWNTNKKSVEFSLLDIGRDETVTNRVAKSFLIQEWEDSGPDWSFVYKLRVWAEDLDGDGCDELVYSTPTQIVAYSLSQEKTLWTHPFTDRQKIEDVVRLPNGGWEIRFWNHDEDGRLETFTALNSKGELLWTDTPPKQWMQNRWAKDLPDVLEFSREGHLPKILYRLTGKKTTFCQTAKPADERTFLKKRREHEQALLAKAELPALPDVTFASATHDVSAATDVRLRRRAVRVGRIGGSFLKPMMLSVVIFFLPLMYLQRLLKGRWTLRMMMLAPLVTLLVLTGLKWPAEFIPQYANGLVSWNLSRAFWFAMAVIPSAIILITIVNWFKNGKWRRIGYLLAAIAIIGFVLALIPLLANHRMFQSSLPIRYDWSGFWLLASMIGVQVVGTLLIFWRMGKSFVGWVNRRLNGNQRSVAA